MLCLYTYLHLPVAVEGRAVSHRSRARTGEEGSHLEPAGRLVPEGSLLAVR